MGLRARLRKKGDYITRPQGSGWERVIIEEVEENEQYIVYRLRHYWQLEHSHFLGETILKVASNPLNVCLVRRQIGPRREDWEALPQARSFFDFEKNFWTWVRTGGEGNVDN